MNLLNKIDFSKPEEIALTRQNTLRIVVGVLGIALPVLLYVFLWIDTSYGKPLESISHYYFTYQRLCCLLWVEKISNGVKASDGYFLPS